MTMTKELQKQEMLVKVEAVKEQLSEIITLGYSVYAEVEGKDILDSVRSLTIVENLSSAVTGVNTILDAMKVPNAELLKRIKQTGMTPEQLVEEMINRAMEKDPVLQLVLNLMQ